MIKITARTKRSVTRKPQQLHEVGEAALLRAIAERGGSSRHVQFGIGDDAALLWAQPLSVVLSTDMLIENIDFERYWASFADMGRKAAGANLSDLAAMGAEPRALLLSLGLRPNESVKNVLALVTAFARFGHDYGAPLVGGDLSRIEGPLVISVTAVGAVAAERAFFRYRAHLDDLIIVSGQLGGAAAALHLLQQGEKTPLSLRRRQLCPTPRLALARELARAGIVHSAIDLSDGLIRDVEHLLPVGARAVFDAGKIPLDTNALRLQKKLPASALELALYGGEDFELCFTLAPRDLKKAQAAARKAATAITVIGEIKKGRGTRVHGHKITQVRGFEHF